MKQGTFLRKVVMVTVAALLVCVGAGYAQEYYQGLGQIEIDSDFLDFSGGHVLIVISDGDVSLQKDVETTDGSLTKDVSASAEGSYNSVHEIIVWSDGSVSSEGSTETADIKTTHSLQVEGSGLFINNAASDEYLYRRDHIIILSNDYD